MNVNFHISRYQALMILIGIIFLLIVIKALTYIPENQNDAQLMQNAKNKVITDVVDEQEEIASPEEDDAAKSDEGVPVEENINKIDDMLAEAEQYRMTENYPKALSIYFDIVNMTDDTKIYATCYDGISKIYTAQNKYDKAIEKAYLANNYEPTDMRKLALVKLYHKIGDIENEQALLQELLEN